MHHFLRLMALSFDKIYKLWQSTSAARLVGSLLVSIYAIALILIHLNIWDVLPHWMAKNVSTNYFDAISLVFTALLIVEVITLIQSLARSVTTSLLKQFELLSLILLRDAFKTFGRFHQPLDWSQDLDTIMYMVADSFGALVIFLIIVLVSRMTRHPQITSSMDAQERFVKVKKSIALLLTVAFVVFGIDHLGIYYLTQEGTDFFETFYTVLIFTDILLVLVSLRYCTDYLVVFRNSAFALATVFIRLALTAPPYVNVAIGIAASVFVLGLVYFYNRFYPKSIKV